MVTAKIFTHNVCEVEKDMWGSSINGKIKLCNVDVTSASNYFPDWLSVPMLQCSKLILQRRIDLTRGNYCSYQQLLNQWSINMLHTGAALQIWLWSQLFSTLGFCDLWWYCSTNSSKNGLTQSDKSGHHSGDFDQLGHRGIYNCKIFFSGESRRGVPFLFAQPGIWDLSLIASHTVESAYL